MPGRSSISTLLLPLVLVLGLGLLLLLQLPGTFGAPPPEAPEDDRLSELVIREIVASEELDAEVVVLQAVGNSVVVPVFVSPQDGAAIRAARMGEDPAQDLLERTITGMGGALRAVLLDQGEGSANLAGKLVVQRERGGDAVSIDASVGSAIATAIASGHPILATPRALEGSGLTSDDLKRLVDAASESAEPETPPLRL